MISNSTSRLDRLLARLTAQKAWLEDAAARVSSLSGPILEVGLGKGRTYDHLRTLMPGRRILAFDLDLHAPSDARPAAADLLLGDFRVTLPRARAEIGDKTAVLIHADFGSEDTAFDALTAEWLGPLLARLLRPAGILLSDRPLRLDGAQSLSPPCPLEWPYFGLLASEPLT